MADVHSRENASSLASSLVSFVALPSLLFSNVSSVESCCMKQYNFNYLLCFLTIEKWQYCTKISGQDSRGVNGWLLLTGEENLITSGTFSYSTFTLSFTKAKWATPSRVMGMGYVYDEVYKKSFRQPLYLISVISERVMTVVACFAST